MAVGTAHPAHAASTSVTVFSCKIPDRSVRWSSIMKTVGSTVGRNHVFYSAVKSSDSQSAGKSYDKTGQHDELTPGQLVNVNTHLIWWGLRGSHYGSTTCPGALTLYQNLVLAFMSLMFVRWILIMFVPMYVTDSAAIMDMLGEMDRNSSTKAGRLFYRTQTLLLALMSLLSIIFCYRHRKDRRVFAWLKLFELMKHQLKPSDLKMTEYMAMIVWRKTVHVMAIRRGCLAVHLLSLMAIITYNNKVQIMAGDFTVIAWSIIHGLWIYLMGVHLFGLIGIFLCVVYYFDIRIKKLIKDLELMNEKDKSLPQMDRAEILYCWLVEFDLFHVELHSFAQFWQNFILVFFLTGYFLLFFELSCFTCFYPYFTWTEWAVVGVCGLFILIVWLYCFLKAAAINEQSKDLYRAINRFCLVPTHDFVQVKMNNFVKKFSSVNRQIGFHCYHMFYLSNEFLYHIFFHSGSCFVLFIDSMISLAYKHLK